MTFNKEQHKFSLSVVLLLLIVWALFEIFTWDVERFYNRKYHLIIIGGLCWFFIYMNSQSIVDKNSFKTYYLLSLLCLSLGFVKIYLTNGKYVDFTFPLLPLIYILTLHIIIKLFYPKYPNSGDKPIIMFGGKGGYVTYKDQNSLTKPPAESGILSLIIFVLPGVITLLASWLLDKMGNL